MGKLMTEVIPHTSFLQSFLPINAHDLSTHNQETFGNRVPQPSKSIRYTSYGNTPELAPVLGYRGYLTNNCIKEIFDVGVLNSGIPELQR